jgi:hypothetical protein
MISLKESMGFPTNAARIPHVQLGWAVSLFRRGGMYRRVTGENLLRMSLKFNSMPEILARKLESRAAETSGFCVKSREKPA